MNKYGHSSSSIALGGVLAAVAVIIMSLGGLIPVATYVCPMLCTIVLAFIVRICGKRIAWAWYGAVAILSLMLSPDKEAAFTFMFLGYYPIVKPIFDCSKLSLLWKLLLFNFSIALMYWLLLQIIGMPELLAEFNDVGTVMIAVLLVMGNAAFFLLDRVLNMDFFGKLGFRG